MCVSVFVCVCIHMDACGMCTYMCGVCLVRSNCYQYFQSFLSTQLTSAVFSIVDTLLVAYVS